MLTFSDQERWAREFLDQLLEDDVRSLLTVVIYLPYQREDNVPENVAARLFRIRSSLDVQWWIDKEDAAEAGNMATLGELCWHETIS